MLDYLSLFRHLITVHWWYDRWWPFGCIRDRTPSLSEAITTSPTPHTLHQLRTTYIFYIDTVYFKRLVVVITYILHSKYIAGKNIHIFQSISIIIYMVPYFLHEHRSVLHIYLFQMVSPEQSVTLAFEDACGTHELMVLF